MAEKRSKMSPSYKVKYGLAASLSMVDGTPPEAIILADDLPRVYSTREGASQFLSSCGISKTSISEILDSAYGGK
jgi:hypothetical protein